MLECVAAVIAWKFSTIWLLFHFICRRMNPDKMVHHECILVGRGFHVFVNILGIKLVGAIHYIVTLVEPMTLKCRRNTFILLTCSIASFLFIHLEDFKRRRFQIMRQGIKRGQTITLTSA